MALGDWAARKSSKNSRAHERIDDLEPAPRAGRVYHPFQDQVGEKLWRSIEGYEQEVARLLKGAKPEPIAIADLTMTQKTVNPDQVHYYIGEASPRSVVVVHMGGEALLYDGHHRVTAEWAKGEDEVEARIVSLDGDRSPSP
jgi:hypothetical protein